MKIIPAHSIEANEMAGLLYEEWISMGLPLNVKLSSGMSETSPTLVQVKDILSRSFGWESWEEMIAYIIIPHEPVYIDDDNQLLTDVALNLSENIGYDYPHGRVISMLQNSGTGYSAKYRRELASLATPWGIIYDSIDIAEGIRSVSTGSHGGYILSEQRQQQMPPHLTNGTPYYEEDCQAALVELAFREIFPNKLKYALATVGVYSASSVPSVYSPEMLKLLDDSSDHLSELFGIPSSKDKRINRELTEDETLVVKYLAKCVFLNKEPVKLPTDTSPRLQDWVDCLHQTMKVNDEWPIMNRLWRNNWEV